MGWGTTINGVFLSRVYLSELKDKKEEHEDYLKILDDQLIALAAQSPTANGDGEDSGVPWHQWVSAEVRNLLEEYRETVVNLTLVNTALDTLQYSPEDVEDDTGDRGMSWKVRAGYVKPGPAKPPEHGPIPEGWEKVVEGTTVEGDQLWYPSMGIWSQVTKRDASLGTEVRGLNTVIRKAGAKPGPAACSACDGNGVVYNADGTWRHCDCGGTLATPDPHAGPVGDGVPF